MDEGAESHGRDDASPLGEGALRAIFHAVNDAIFVHDAEGDIVDVNETAAEMYGYSRAEFREGDLPETSSGEDSFTVEGSIDRLQEVAEGESETFEWQGQDREGNVFWEEVSVSKTVVDGELRLLAIVRDIDERKRYEQELEYRKALLEAQAEATIDGFLVVGDDREVLSYNTRFRELWDVPPEWPHGRAGDTALRPVFAALAEPEAFRSAAEALHEQPDVEGRDEVRLADGRWMDWYSAPVVGTEWDDGEHYGRLWVFRDVTERKEREREIQEEHEKYTTLVEQSHEGVLIAQDGEIKFVNSAMVELTGRSADELLGLDMTAFVAPEYRDLVEERYRQRMAGGTPPRQYDIEILTAEGERRHIALSVSVVTYEGERATMVTFNDITERKERERELRRKNERLEEFASIVSHDLRNPLNVADGRLELVMADCDSEHLEGIREAHQRMERLIDDLLTLAREGAAVQSIEPIDLGAVADRCWRNVETGDARLVADATGTIRADPSRLLQLLENLIRNAVEYGGEAVTVRVGDLDDGFYVADDGPGIPADERDSVFESGYSTSAAGTGFGLSIVKGIVEAHGWTVTASASEGAGARFDITGVDVADGAG
jgi:PAS domain S-box-containing protein